MVNATQLYSPRITGIELPRSGRPLLIVNYRVAGTADNPQIELDGVNNPLKEVDWMRKNGTITPQMKQLLDAERSTCVYTKYIEGLGALWWYFWDRERPVLVSGFVPWDWDFDGGSLLGSVVEGDGRIKIQ